MKITNIGGATAILEHKNKRMLVDPWLNEGILYGSWYHFPPLRIGIEDVGRFDYIYISHIHEDHCAPGTIRRLNRDAEIIVMDREPAIPNYVARFLDNYDFRFKALRRVRPYTPTEIAPGLIADMVEADPANNYNYLIDSGLILNWDGFIIYNANDCAPYPRAIDYIKKTYGKVDLALLPYTGGSGYPGCYTSLSHAEKLSEKKRLFKVAMDVFVEAVRSLDPRYVIPFADQYVIAGSRYLLNDYSPHPACPGACAGPLAEAGLAKKLLLLNSAQSFDFDIEAKSPDEAYRFFTEEDRMAYAESLADKRYVHEEIALNPGVPVARLLGAARHRLWSVQQKEGWFPDSYLYIDVPDRKQRFEISLTKDGVTELSLDLASILKQPYVKMLMPSTLLILMLINHVSWNMADGSLFIDYERVPNVYDPKLYANLNHLTV